MISNDYMNCDFYENQAKNANKDGFVTFADKKTSKHYFAYINKATGKVIFRSEGYPTAAAQKAGLTSLTKNMSNETLYSVVEENKQYLVILKAKNNVEIARSCPFTAKKEAEMLIAELCGTVMTPSVEVKPAAAKVATPAKVEKTVEKTPAPAAVKTETTSKKVETKKVEKTADVLEFANTELYLGHETLDKTGFALFSAGKTKHYFVVYNMDGSIFQRSAGFNTIKERDEMFKKVQFALMNENAYKVVQEGDKFVVQIVDENAKVLCVSTVFNTFDAAFKRTPKGWMQLV
ncbi:MAG: hypothetical protein ACOYOA_14850 [Saprospiraceae bacterium]